MLRLGLAPSHPAPGREAETPTVRKESGARLAGRGGASQPLRPHSRPAPPLLPCWALLASSPAAFLPDSCPLLSSSPLPPAFLLLRPSYPSNLGCPHSCSPRWPGASSDPRLLPSPLSWRPETLLPPPNTPSELSNHPSLPRRLSAFAVSRLTSCPCVLGTQELRPSKSEKTLSSCGFDPHGQLPAPLPLSLHWPPHPSLACPASWSFFFGCPSPGFGSAPRPPRHTRIFILGGLPNLDLGAPAPTQHTHTSPWSSV